MSNKADELKDFKFDGENSEYLEDNLKKYKSQEHRSFFESRFSKAEVKPGYLNAVENTVANLEVRVKDGIKSGSQKISPNQSNLRPIMK
jgi:hypothetical protein